MAEQIPFRRPINWKRLRADEAEALIRERAKVTKNVRIGTHAFDRVDERSIVVQDVYRILRTGFVEGEPTPGQDDGEWKVVMVKRMRGTREAGAVTVLFQDSESVLVVTVEWMDHKR